MNLLAASLAQNTGSHPLTAPEEGVGSLKARGLTPDDEVVRQRPVYGRGRRRFPSFPPFVLSQWLSIPVDRVSPNAGIRLASLATPDTPGPTGGVPRPTVARKPWSLEPKPRGRSHTSRLIPKRSRSISCRSRTPPRRILGTKHTPSRRTCSSSRSAPRRDRSPSSSNHPLLPPGRVRSMPIMLLLYLSTIAAPCKPCQP